MFTQLENMLTENISVVNSSPAFTAHYQHLGIELSGIEGKRELISLSTTGHAKDKKSAKEALSNLLVAVCGGLKAYASEHSDQALAQQVNYSYSDLMRIRATDLESTAAALHKLATDHAEALQAYNVEADTLTKLGLAVSSFKKKNPAPRKWMTTNKTTRELLAEQIKSLNNYIREKMDPLAQTYLDKDKKFCMLYDNARRNYTEGVRHNKPQAATLGKETAAPPTIVEQPTANALLQMALHSVPTNGEVQAEG